MALIFSDSFVESTDTDLHLHTPNTGTSWTVVWQSAAGTKWVVVAADDNITQAGASNTGAIYSADATYSTADYAVEGKVVNRPTTTSTSWYMFLRLTDQDNFYALKMSGNGDYAIYKKVTGTFTLLGATFAGPAIGTVVKFEVSGSTLKVYYDGVEQASRTDSDITATGKAGIGLGGGAELVTSGHDPNTNYDIDDFAVNTLAAGATDLVIQDAAHAHAADSLALTQVHNLTVADAGHGHSTDAVALTQVHILTVADASHGHIADELSLTQIHNLSVADASHGHAADNVVLATEGELGVQGADHAHAADNVVLTQVHNLTVQDGTHIHNADSLVLVPGLGNLDSSHAHSADNLALSQVHILVMQDATHSHIADNVAVTGPSAPDIDGPIYATFGSSSTSGTYVDSQKSGTYANSQTEAEYV